MLCYNFQFLLNIIFLPLDSPGLLLLGHGHMKPGDLSAHKLKKMCLNVTVFSNKWPNSFCCKRIPIVTCKEPCYTALSVACRTPSKILVKSLHLVRFLDYLKMWLFAMMIESFFGKIYSNASSNHENEY